MPSRPPLKWERRPEGNRLWVSRVNPVGRWAKGGLTEGDEVVAVGALQDTALTLKAIAAVADRGNAHTWRVRRNGVELLLNAPVAD